MRIPLIFCMVICAYSIARAQDPNLTDLRAPSSPAFTILGVQPSEVSRPKSLNALEASIYSSFTNQNKFVIPNDYALEFTPYWLVSHPRLTFDKYVNPELDQSFIQNLAISVATNKYTNPNDSSITGNRMAIGFRTKILSGKASFSKVEVIDQKQDILASAMLVMLALSTSSTAISPETLIDEIKKQFKEIYETQTMAHLKEGLEEYLNESIIPLINLQTITDNTTAQAAADVVVKDITADTNGTLAELAKEAKALQEEISDRYGWIIELAGAGIVDFPTGNTNYSKFDKWGVWLTPTYRLKNNKIDFIGVFRFIRNEIPEVKTSNFDIGFKFVYQKGKFDFSAEGIHRWSEETLSSEQIAPDTYIVTKKFVKDSKLVANLSYRISESMIVTYSFGSNFSKNVETAGNLISTASLSFGLGQPSAKDVPKF